METVEQTSDLTQLTQATMAVLDSWALETPQVMALLALPRTVRARHVPGFRQTRSFPDEPQVRRHAQYILRIADALRTTFPANPAMAGHWIRQGHRRFGQQTPLSVMLQGEEGLVSVLAQLDCTFHWDQSGSRAH